MKVVVTGATGFFGAKRVWRLINSGDEVWCVVGPGEDRRLLASYRAQFIEGDITLPHALDGHLDGVEAVYHCAETIHGDAFEDFVRPNVDAVHHVASACAAQPTPPVFVLISSMAAAGPTRRAQALNEAEGGQPVSDYGRSKQAAEGAARAYAGRMPVSIVRPGVVFGERDRETLPYFKLARKGWLVALGARDEPISVIHVADLAHLVEIICWHGERLAPDGPAHRGVYYAARDQTSFGELGGLMAEIFHREVRVVSAPGVLGLGAAALLELTGRLWGRNRKNRVDLKTVRTAVGAGAWHCDPSKALALPIKLRMTLPERLAQAAEWYRDAGWLDDE